MWVVIALNSAIGMVILWRDSGRQFGTGSEPRIRLLGVQYGFYVAFGGLLYWNMKAAFGIHIAYYLIYLLLPHIWTAYVRDREQKDIDRGMVNFLEVLNARLLVDDDVLHALENTADVVPSKTIRRILKEFNLTMKISCNPALAFQKMTRVRHSYLRYVFMNMEHVFNSWGKARELVQELENEYVSVQTELNKGRAELQNDKLMTYGGLFLAGITSANVLTSDPQMVAYYSARPLFAVVLLLTAMIGVSILSTTRI